VNERLDGCRGEWGLALLAEPMDESCLQALPPLFKVNISKDSSGQWLENSLRFAVAEAEIAFEVGYETEASFNRAFKRQFHLPPARYRTSA
jgi:AraC-like DNA-binding protein